MRSIPALYSLNRCGCSALLDRGVRVTLSQTVQANVRRIAQAIRSIELIACVYENILDVKAFSEIIKRQFTFVVHQKTIWIYNTHIPTVSKSLEQMGICRH